MAAQGVEETAPGSGEYKVKGVGSKTTVDHLFHCGVAAAVAFDVSHILALKVGIIKNEQKKGYNFSQESRAILGHLVHIENVTDRDQVPLVVKHVGRMLDAFLERQDPLFPALEEKYDQRVFYCFRDYENFRQMHIDQVPGLKALKDAHDSGAPFTNSQPKRRRRAVRVNAQQQEEEVKGSSLGGNMAICMRIPFGFLLLH